MSDYLQKTEIKLLDGKPYRFAALPFNRKTAKILCDLFHQAEEINDTDLFDLVIEAYQISLECSYNKERAEEIISSGVLPWPHAANGSKEQVLLHEILNAMSPHFAEIVQDDES